MNRRLTVKTIQVFAFAALVVIGYAPALVGQEQVSPNVEYRKWDATTGVGLIGVNRRDVASTPWGGTHTTGIFTAEVGRYWSTHWKTDFQLLLNERTQFPTDYVFTPDTGSYSLTQTERRRATVAGAVTYQFGENSFVHPYFSAGVRLTPFAKIHRIYRFNSGPPFIEDSSDRTIVQTRPFLAFGFKSYFNERTFMKSELLGSAGPRGFSHVMARVGFGFDF
jgi:hypothetical protein